MKLLIFLIVVIAIYFIATRIKLVNIDSLPTEDRKALKKRQKMRSIVRHNHAKCENDKPVDIIEPFSPIDNRIDKTLSSNSILNTIYDEYLDPNYRFNIATKPETYRKIDLNSYQDKKYMKHIKNNILNWNNLFKKDLIKIKTITPTFINEASDEFVLSSNVALVVNNDIVLLGLTFYGKIDRTEDHLDGGYDKYIIQLVEMKPVDPDIFDNTIKEFQKQKPYNHFMTISEQNAYVKKRKDISAKEFN